MNNNFAFNSVKVFTWHIISFSNDKLHASVAKLRCDKHIVQKGDNLLNVYIIQSMSSNSSNHNKNKSLCTLKRIAKHNKTITFNLE